MNFEANEDLIAATATVIANAVADSTLPLPDIELAVQSLDQIGEHHSPLLNCPARVHELLEQTPMPQQRDLCDLLVALRDAATTMSWVDPYEDRPDQTELRAGYFATVITAVSKREAALANDDIASVFFTVQAPHILYPPHSHLAPELYCAVAGEAEWQKSDEPFGAKPAGSWVVHSPWTSHAMQTRDEPLVALAIWTADLQCDVTLDD